MRPYVHPETINLIVEEYDLGAKAREAEARWWRGDGLSFPAVIDRVGQAELFGKRHPHQYRLSATALVEGTGSTDDQRPARKRSGLSAAMVSGPVCLQADPWLGRISGLRRDRAPAASAGPGVGPSDLSARRRTGRRAPLGGRAAEAGERLGHSALGHSGRSSPTVDPRDRGRPLHLQGRIAAHAPTVSGPALYRLCSGMCSVEREQAELLGYVKNLSAECPS